MDIVSPSIFRRKNALTSIWAIPGAALLLAAIVLAWVSYDEYEETIEREYRFLDAHVRIAQNRIAELVHDVRQVLNHVASESQPYLADRATAAAPRLGDFSHDVPEIHALTVLNPSGRVALAADPKLVGFDDSRREYFTAYQQAPHSSGIRVTHPYETIYGDFSVGFSLPIRTPGQEAVLGIAVAAVRYRVFDEAMREIAPEKNDSAVAIIDDAGDLLYRYPDSANRVGRNVSANELFQTFIKSGKPTTIGRSVSVIDGVERIYVLRAIADAPINVAISMPISDVLHTWRRNLALRVVLFVFGGALILGLTWLAQRRQQEALAGKRFTDQIMETANSMMVGVDTESRVVAVNEATERVTGYRREELLGRSVFDTIMPRDRFPAAWQSFLRYREGGELPRAFEAPILTRSGEQRMIAWQNTGIFAHGNELALLSFGIDVTERTQLQQIRNREEISRGLVAMQEEERRRLATELHDRTSPNLTVLDINLKLLANSLPKNAPRELSDIIEDTSATLADTIASIRSVSLDFRPPLLDYAGLWPALNAYARQFTRRTGMAVEFAEQEGILRLAPDVETNLFHIAREALTNCAQHSNARTVSIRQTSQGNDLILTICDDGDGFDPATAHRGTGLAAMRQRANFIGGKLYVESHPGNGTCIAIKFCASGTVSYLRTGNDGYSPASHESAPQPAARPLAKQAVSR